MKITEITSTVNRRKGGAVGNSGNLGKSSHKASIIRIIRNSAISAAFLAVFTFAQPAKADIKANGTSLGSSVELSAIPQTINGYNFQGTETVTFDGTGGTMKLAFDANKTLAGIVFQGTTANTTLNTTEPGITTTFTISGNNTGFTKTGGSRLALQGSGSFSSDIVINDGTLEFGRKDSSDTITVNGSISGSGLLSKRGSGTLTLSGVNTLTGSISINDTGTLELANTQNQVLGSVTFSGGTLKQSGIGTTTFNSDVTVTSLTSAAIIERGAEIILHGGGLNSFTNVSGDGTLTVGNGSSLYLTGTNTICTINLNSGGIFGSGATNISSTGIKTVNAADGTNIGYAGRNAIAMTVGAGGTLNIAGTTTLVTGLNGGNTLTLNGGTLGFTSLGTIDANNHNVTLTSGTIDFKGMFTDGDYTLVKNSSTSFSGLPTGVTVTNGGNALGSRAGIAWNNSTSGTLKATYTVNNVNQKWTGSSDGNWNTTATNWGNTTDQKFTSGDYVVFDSTTAQKDIAIAGNEVYVSGMEVIADGYTFTGNAKIVGRAGVVDTNVNKTGNLIIGNGITANFNNTGGVDFVGGIVVGTSSTMAFGATSGTVAVDGVISGAGAVTYGGGATYVVSGNNIYTGDTKITTDATLEVKGTWGTGNTYSGVITNNGTLNMNQSGAQTLSGVISGDGALVKNGSNDLTLSGANTYTGATTVNAGTLKLDTAGTIAKSSGLNLTASGATFDFGDASSDVTVQALNGVAGTSVNGGGSNALTIGDDTNNRDSSFAGQITNVTTLTKDGTGTLTLSGAGNMVNSLVVNAGTLDIISNGAGLGVNANSTLTVDPTATLQTRVYKDGTVWKSNLTGANLTWVGAAGSAWIIDDRLAAYNGTAFVQGLSFSGTGLDDANAALGLGNTKSTFFNWGLVEDTVTDLNGYYRLQGTAKPTANVNEAVSSGVALMVNPMTVSNAAGGAFSSFSNNYSDTSYRGQSGRYARFGAHNAWVNYVGRSNEIVSNFEAAAGQR
ncbi:MAG: beta strand repeat-containing protein, partial [Thermoguttaceae bacterium]